MNSLSSYIILLTIVSTVQSFRYVAYFTSWSIYGRNYQPSAIPFDKISHLNYAFANIASGQIALGDSYADADKAYPGDTWDTTKQAYRGNFWQLLKVAKPKYPNLRVLISIGGWSWSKDFSTVASTSSTRKTFVDSVVAFLQQYEFDGVDIDWEYPVSGGLDTNTHSPDDGKNYVLLLSDLRAGLDTLPGDRRLITVAAPAGPDKVQNLDIPGMAQYVDFLNVMTYDYRGGWSTYTGHQTPLYPEPASSVDPSDDPDKTLGYTSTIIDYYLFNGMPANKLCVGAAMYGRGWAGVSSANNGLYQKFTTVPKGTWDDWSSGNTGVFDYKDIKSKISTGGFTRYWDDTVKAPWVYSSTQQMTISYDDVQSVTEKVNFVKKKSLGGMMVWELSGDDNYELSTTINTQLYGGGGVPPPTDNGTYSSSGSGATNGGSSNSSNTGSSGGTGGTDGTGSGSNSGQSQTVADTASGTVKNFDITAFFIGLVVGVVLSMLVAGVLYYVFRKQESNHPSEEDLVKKDPNATPKAKVVKSAAVTKPIKQPASLKK